MANYIGHKLDYLMRLTGTKNNVLAKALDFDSSHISRIRSNERGTPQHRPFVEPAALFFAKTIREPYQIKGIRDAICPDMPWPEAEEERKLLIAAWLNDGDSREPFVSKEGWKTNLPENGKQSGQVFYYGNKGRRQAVERLLRDLGSSQSPPQLLLYSDEDISWIFEDSSFARGWMELMSGYLKRGGKIQIIHNLGRNIGEMLEAVRKWMPLYMVGEIQPFFCTRIRDGVFRQTRFIAKGTAAILSSSVSGQGADTGNIYITDSDMVRSLEQEFSALLHMCRPLMQVFSPGSGLNFSWELDNLEQIDSDLLASLVTPLPFTLPETIAAALTARTKLPVESRVKKAKKRYLQQFANGRTVTELLHLPAPAVVRERGVAAPLCDLAGSPELRYTPEEFAAHLRGVVDMLQRERLYQVFFTKYLPENTNILVKEGIGALVCSATPPTTCFSIREQPLIGAIWEYLYRAAEPEDRKDVINTLNAYIQELEQ